MKRKICNPIKVGLLLFSKYDIFCTLCNKVIIIKRCAFSLGILFCSLLFILYSYILYPTNDMTLLEFLLCRYISS